MSQSGVDAARSPGPTRLLSWALPRTVVPAIWLFLASLSPQHDVYASADYGLPLLAVLGTAGCVGYALAFLSGHLPFSFGSGTLLAGPLRAEAVSVGGPGKGEEWPLLIVLLFAPFLILFSGLGGWVEARGPSRAARRSASPLVG